MIKMLGWRQNGADVVCENFTPLSHRQQAGRLREKRDLLICYNATCLYLFKDEHIVLDNLLLDSSMGKNISPIFNICHSCSFLYKIGTGRLYPILLDVSLSVILVQIMFYSVCYKPINWKRWRR